MSDVNVVNKAGSDTLCIHKYCVKNSLILWVALIISMSGVNRALANDYPIFWSGLLIFVVPVLLLPLNRCLRLKKFGNGSFELQYGWRFFNETLFPTRHTILKVSGEPELSKESGKKSKRYYSTLRFADVNIGLGDLNAKQRAIVQAYIG